MQILINGVGFLTWRHTFKMQWSCHFRQKSAAIWWVLTQSMPGSYAAASASAW